MEERIGLIAIVSCLLTAWGAVPAATGAEAQREPVNVVENGDFEVGPAGAESRGKVPPGWGRAFGRGPGTLEIVSETRPGSAGEQCLKVNTSERLKTGGLFTEKVPLDPQKVLQVSGWMKGGGVLKIPQGAYFGVGWYDSDKRPITVKQGTTLNYTYLGSGYKKEEWVKRTRIFYPSFEGEKENYGGDEIPPNAAFFDIRIFALEYPRPAYFDDIFATQDIAKSDWLVGWEGDRGAAKAAMEMAKYMSEVLGVEVAAAPWRGYRAKHTFVITDAKHAPPEAAERLEGKRLDAFLILYPARLHDREVCLLVANEEKAYDFPAYYFLTKYMGVEWVGPDPLGEILTPQPDWTMPERIDELQEPDYEHRYWSSIKVNARRWLAGSFRLQFHHNLWRVFDPRKYADQADLYPFYGAKRNVPDPNDRRRLRSGWQPCTANPKAVDIAVQYGLDYLAANPDKRSFSLSVNDGGAGCCLCERCRAQDSKGAFDAGAPHLTDRFFRFYNQVIERVLQKNPDAYLAVLGYGRCQTLPVEVQVNPRILVFNVCDNDLFYMTQRQRDWKAAGATPCIYLWLWDCGYLTVRHYPHAVRDLIAVTHSLGGFGYYCEAITNWAAGGPKFYVLARVLWDTNADVDALLDRYMQLSFGPDAAPAMRAYFDRWEEIWERGGEAIRYNTGRNWRHASQLDRVTREDLGAMDSALERARAAQAAPEQKQRLGHVATYYEWLRINADQYLVARELADDAWVAKQAPDHVMREAERGMGLTPAFDAIWKDTISKDRTGWLLSARYHGDPERLWKTLIQPVRKGVLAAYEPALDHAFDVITRRMLKTKPKGQVVAYWQDQTRRHPKLAKWAGTQVYLLQCGPGENVVSNGDFERGKPGDPPQIEGWRTVGAWSDIPAEFAWQPNSGRNGSAAAMIGRGYAATIRGTARLEKGSRYRISVWYKTTGRHTRVVAGVPGAALQLSATNGEWRHASTTFTGSRDGTVIIGLSAYGQDKGQWTWFDNVAIVEIGGK